jgi:hypothetical protein
MTLGGGPPDILNCNVESFDQVHTEFIIIFSPPSSILKHI